MTALASPVLVPRGRVAVIGMGITGLAALKNLVEMGFDATGIERAAHVGGIWHFAPDPTQPTALKNEQHKVDDFPFPDEYLSAAKVADYVDAYVAHFDLAKRVRLNTAVRRIARAPGGADAWALELDGPDGHDGQGSRTETFDRVVVTTGPHTRAYRPCIAALDGYAGEVVHANAYKGPDDFKGKRVLIVGMSNTGCDIAVDLAGSAEHVYLSHRSGVRLGSRYTGGKPTVHIITRRAVALGELVRGLAPDFSARLLERVVDWRMRRAYKPDPAWKLLPAPPITNATPVINEHIVDLLRSGAVTSLTAITGSKGKTVRTAEGEFDVDVVIFSTSGQFDYAVLDPAVDPTASTPADWSSHANVNGLPFPRLYRTMFSLEHPDSLALIGACRGWTFAAFNNADLQSQAVGRVWAGAYALPPRAEQERWCDANYAETRAALDRYTLGKTGHGAGFEAWLNAAAGNGVNEHLGWGWQGWRFWWAEHKLYRLIMGGINTTYVGRLFDGAPGARKKWDGAKEAIYRANGLTYEAK